MPCAPPHRGRRASQNEDLALGGNWYAPQNILMARQVHQWDKICGRHTSWGGLPIGGAAKGRIGRNDGSVPHPVCRQGRASGAKGRPVCGPPPGHRRPTGGVQPPCRCPAEPYTHKQTFTHRHTYTQTHTRPHTDTHTWLLLLPLLGMVHTQACSPLIQQCHAVPAVRNMEPFDWKPKADERGACWTPKNVVSELLEN